MNNMNTIVYCSDGNDIRYLKASMFSVEKFMNGDVRFIVLTASPERFDIPGLEVIDVSEELKSVGFFPDGWNRKWPYATLFRMMIPLVPELRDKERVLYLDTDCLVRSPAVRNLFTVRQDGEVMGSKDGNGRCTRILKNIYSDLCLTARVQVKKRLWSLHRIQGATYVNAGVLLYFPQSIHKDWYRQRLKWFWEAECRGKFRYLDQDFVNSMMRVGLLDQKFNVFSTKNRIADPYIRHFICRTKPRMIEEAKGMGYTEDE